MENDQSSLPYTDNLQAQDITIHSLKCKKIFGSAKEKIDNSFVKKCIQENDLNVPNLHFNIGSDVLLQGINPSPWKS